MVDGCQAGWLGHLLQNMREYNAESPKQGRKRLYSIAKTIGFDHPVIIYLWVHGAEALIGRGGGRLSLLITPQSIPLNP